MGRHLETKKGLYLKGVRKERGIVNIARKQGYIAFRSAGSHSPIDVVVIKPEIREIHLYQCKPDNFSLKQKEKLEKELTQLNNLFVVSFHII